MWARHIELMLGLWLAVSPFVFRHDPTRPALWAHDLVMGTTLVTVALLTHWHPLRRLHLTALGLAGWLIGVGWLAAWTTGEPAPPASQNWIVVGLLLGMFAVIPTEANAPPETWREPGGSLAETRRVEPTAGPRASARHPPCR